MPRRKLDISNDRDAAVITAASQVVTPLESDTFAETALYPQLADAFHPDQDTHLRIGKNYGAQKENLRIFFFLEASGGDICRKGPNC
jgi:hypothetical protein